jgi:hypothetical protein
MPKLYLAWLAPDYVHTRLTIPLGGEVLVLCTFSLPLALQLRASTEM